MTKEVDFSDVKDYAGRKVQQAASSVQGQMQNAQHSYREQAESRKIKDIREMFVNSNEEQKAVIGKGYLHHLIQFGEVRKGFGVLTDRRFYFRGSCFYKIRGNYVKTNEDCTVDVQDITSSGFTYTRYLSLLILTILDAIWLCVLFVIIADSYKISMMHMGNFLFALLIDIALIISYIYFKRVMYEITFAGGSLSIKVPSYNIKEVRDFDKVLHQVKDEFLARR